MLENGSLIENILEITRKRDQTFSPCSEIHYWNYNLEYFDWSDIWEKLKSKFRHRIKWHSFDLNCWCIQIPMIFQFTFWGLFWQVNRSNSILITSINCCVWKPFGYKSDRTKHRFAFVQWIRNAFFGEIICEFRPIWL